TYKHLLQMLAPVGSTTALLGLSATPGRSRLDLGEDQRLADFFTRQKAGIPTAEGDNPVAFLQREGYIAVPDYRFIPYRPSITLSPRDQQALAEGLDISEDALRRLGDDEKRNLLIIKEILNQADRGGRILVFACSVGHAQALADTLAVKGIRAASVSGKT